MGAPVLFPDGSWPSHPPARELLSSWSTGVRGSPDSGQTGSGLSGAVLAAIVNSLTDGVVVAGTDGQFILFNAAAERMLGIGARQVGPEQWSATYGVYRSDGVTPFPADELPLVRAIRGETVHDCEVLIRNDRLAGDLWLSINSGPVLDETGAIRGGVIVFRDVSAKKSEMRLMQMLSAAAEQTADCVIITNRDGVIEFANPAAEVVTGYSRLELIGAKPRLFRSDAHPPAFYAGMWATLLKGESFRATIVNRRKQGALYLSEQSITPVRDATGVISHFVSVGKDITESRKATERESKLQLARLVQQRLLPDAPPGDCGLDIAGQAVMADETGGDFFDYIPLVDGRMGIVIGDVSGHAFDAALVMAQAHAYLRSIALIHTDPARILSLANHVMLEDALDQQFVTALFMAIDARAGEIAYASAGHTSGYVFDRRGTLTHTLDSTGIPLGLFRESRYGAVTVQGLSEGSLIVLITDGVVEAENRHGVPFGAERALAAIRSCGAAPAAEVVQCLKSAVSDFAGDQLQVDDITIVACRVAARG